MVSAIVTIWDATFARPAIQTKLLLYLVSFLKSGILKSKVTPLNIDFRAVRLHLFCFHLDIGCRISPMIC